MNSDTITISKQVQADEFFWNLLGSAWESWDWWHVVEYDNGYDWDTYPGDWDKPFLTVGICDPDEDDETATVTKKLSLNDLLKAYRETPNLDWENHEAWSGDCVLQTAVLGTVVYG